MDDAGARVIDLIFGRWRSQILYVGVQLGIFDALVGSPENATSVARELGVDADNLYRLMRALGSLGLLKEDNSKTFSLTQLGELLRKDHPHALRGMTLLEEGPEHYVAWKHLVALIQEGRQNAPLREFGQSMFEYAAQHPNYAAVFNEAMTSYSSMDNTLLLEALNDCDFSRISHLCDVGGGHGSTLCSLLLKYPHLKGTVLELPSVIENTAMLWADKMDVGDRCIYVPGDMFREIPAADAYLMKHVIHDWNDAECRQILAIMHQAAPRHARVFIAEQVVPGPDTPHFSKLFDIHMLIMVTGRERTIAEYAELLEGAGWKYEKTWYPRSKSLGIVEGVKA